MQKFIKKILLFSTIPLVVGVIALVVFVKHINALSSDYKIDTSINTLYAGDSHIELAVDDRLIPGSINVSTNSETFYFSYYKLKLFLEHNSSVKKVYLGLSYHNLSSYNERFISGDFSPLIAPKYFYILPAKQQFKMLTWNKKNISSFIKSIVKIGKEQRKHKNEYPFIGGFENIFENTRAVDSSMNKRIQFQFYKEGKLNDFSDLNLSYLDKIIVLCKSKNVELTIVNTPLHPYYLNKIPEVYKDKYKDIIKTNKLKHIDLSTITLREDYYIPDGDHVSYYGAQKISDTIRVLTNGN